MNDARKFCKDDMLPEVFAEAQYEMDTADAVAARNTTALVDALKQMSSSVSDSFLMDSLECIRAFS